MTELGRYVRGYSSIRSSFVTISSVLHSPEVYGQATNLLIRLRAKHPLKQVEFINSSIGEHNSLIIPISFEARNFYSPH